MKIVLQEALCAAVFPHLKHFVSQCAYMNKNRNVVTIMNFLAYGKRIFFDKTSIQNTPGRPLITNNQLHVTFLYMRKFAATYKKKPRSKKIALTEK